jgi:competence protein ComEC
LTDGVYGNHSQLTFDASEIRANDQKLAGTLRVSGFGANMVFAGNKVQVQGKLRRGLGQYQGFISYGRIAVIDNHSPPIAGLRRKFIAGLQTALPEPLASFAAGLLIGQRSTLPDSVKQDLLIVGLTHIVAVSGYNLTIMLRASQRLLGGGSKRLMTLLAFGLIGLFLLLTGFSASIIRAAIVSSLSIWAAYFGRAFRPVNLIAFAAAITAFAKPFYVWSDAGWYLSFLAFFGVLVVAPAIASNWSARWRNSLVIMAALESMSAEIMTMPYVLHMFGQVSLIALPANLLVVALVPLAMLASFVAGLMSMASPWLSSWLAWPAILVLTYMLDIAHLFARLPHVFMQHLQLSGGQMLLLYGSAGLVVSVLLFKNRQKTL